MGHEHGHAEEKKPLSFFASPLHSHEPANQHDLSQSHSVSGNSDIEYKGANDPNVLPLNNNDTSLHDSPAFHRHAEATTSELFYDLFFVANLTTFTSNLEINDRNSLTAYIGFFSLLWLTWYQVSLYDVRFSTDSVFERIAKALHFGVMVGFAVIGSQWKPGQEIVDYKIYKAFGLILMVSRITLFAQYVVTLWYTKRYKKTVVPLILVMGSTLIAALMYGALTPAFPSIKYDVDGNLVEQKSNAYIAWYVIALCETMLTVAVSCIWRVISFKGTHMVQRMSLLTLIILGEGIIVVCKSISKIVKNDYLWTASVVGQIIAAVLIIYFLYMLYFDRMQEEHFGSIKQQIWSFSHFPLHTVLVLVLQGVSLLIVWTQAVQGLVDITNGFNYAIEAEYPNGLAFAMAMEEVANSYVYDFVPKGVDASAEREQAFAAIMATVDAYDYLLADQNNETAATAVFDGITELYAACTKTMFDGLSVTIPKKKKKTEDEEPKKVDIDYQLMQYVQVFELVFMYVFIAGGMSLIITTFLGYLSLPASQKTMSHYIRLGLNLVGGIGLTLVSTIKVNYKAESEYMFSAWMIPTICILYFICVVINHIPLPLPKHKGH